MVKINLSLQTGTSQQKLFCINEYVFMEFRNVVFSINFAVKRCFGGFYYTFCSKRLNNLTTLNFSDIGGGSRAIPNVSNL